MPMDTTPLLNALDLQTLRDKTPNRQGLKEYIDELNNRVADAVTALSNNTGAVSDDTIEDIIMPSTAPSVVDDAALRSEIVTALTSLENNVSDLAAKVNNIISVLKAAGLMKNS